MIRKTKNEPGYSSPDCEVKYLSPQSQILSMSKGATMDGFSVNDDSSDPYFG